MSDQQPDDTAAQWPEIPENASAGYLAALLSAAYGENARLRQECDTVQAERDTLVDAIAGLVSLPPAEIAKAYSVGYGATAQPTAALRTQLRAHHAALAVIRGAIRALDTATTDTQTNPATEGAARA